jgi:pimeloyl-ACP methyl ester carboxylesterase
MGGAWVWIEYLQFFAARGIPCYAVSMRGHGGSWHPSYLRMVYATTKRMLANDVVAGLRWAQEREGGREAVLVGHSSGGGLSQFILSEGDVKVKGLVLVAAVPGFGS